MGFPAGYSDLPLPGFLLHLALILGYVRRFICLAFVAVGLGDLLDSDDDGAYAHGHHLHLHRQLQFRSPSVMLIQEALPVVRYEELAAAGGQHVGGGCAVCLHEFELAEEVRRLTNCRHVFHRRCLDSWLEHDQRTCPLCRAALLPEEMQGALDDQMWAAAGVPDSYMDDLDAVPSYSHPPNHQLVSAY